MNTFISYASAIKKTAGRIKEYLDQYGFNCFLAHEDIPPQTVWPVEILRALKECDLFLPLLTQKFIESFYCQQKTGFAYCKGVEILPVKISKAPMGMIADLQAVRFNKNEFDSSKISFNNSINFSKPPVVMISFNTTMRAGDRDVNKADNTVTVSSTTNDFTVYTYDIQKGSTVRPQDTRFSFVVRGK